MQILPQSKTKHVYNGLYLQELTLSVMLNTAITRFQYYKSLGDHTFNQLSDNQLFWIADKTSNSIALLVQHLWGNMRSRWTDFLTSDGEKEWRNRDTEFEPYLNDRKEMLQKWEEGWAILFKALNGLSETDLSTIVLIRNEEHTVEAAILRQLCHYSYHIGQIVQLGKWQKKEDWQSLSIPKNQSDQFNTRIMG